MPQSATRHSSDATSRDVSNNLAAGDAQTRLTALHAKLAKAENRVESLLGQIDTLTHQKAHLEKLLEDILGSASWRITRPLRTILAAVRACRPLIRRRRVTFDWRPGTSVEIDGATVSVTGPSATIYLDPTRGARIPTGWVSIRSKVDAEKHPIFTLLYYKVGSGYDGSKRVWLPLSHDSGDVTLAYLPSETKELRLDPFDPNARFTVKHFEIQEIGKVQRLWYTVSRHLRGAWKNPKGALRKISKGVAIFREGGIPALRARLFQDDQFTHNYQEWVRRYDTLTDADRTAIRRDASELTYRPLISIVMPTYNPPERWLRAAIESVRKQLYDHWELCIADDCSTEPHVEKVLREYAELDPRIKVTFRETNGHISVASNSAAALATGEFIGLLDHDDELTEHALYMMVVQLKDSPHLDMLYSDEDKLTTYGMRFNPYFKSGWNPELLCSQNYVCHFTVVRAETFKRVGGFRKGFEGAQDWDLILRVADASTPDRIRHVPHVLYHWRVIETSTAHSTSAKPYVMEAQKKAVEEHLVRRGENGASVQILETISQLRVRRKVPTPEPLVSVIIPTRDQLLLLSRCVTGVLEQTAYKNIELIIVDNGSEKPETLEYLEGLSRDSRVRVIRDDLPFNYSRLNNTAVALSKGSILAFLNNDLEVIEPNWLSEMVSHVVREEVGGVGARLLFPNGLLQHGGVILGIGGVAGHNHKGRLRHDPGYFNRAVLPQNLSAVTAACLLVRREVFDKVGGFEEGALSVAFNDVDLCLKIRREGFLVVYTPYAELYHHESASRGYETTPEKFARFESEIEVMTRRWGALLVNDPYYNPNLTLLTEDFAFGFPPRTEKPWLSRSGGNVKEGTAKKESAVA